MREETAGHFENDDFDTELGVIGGNFATSGATADYNNDFGESVSFEGGFGSEIIDGFGARNFEDFRFSAGGEDEIACGVFLIVYGDGVGIKKIGVATDAGDASVFKRFFVVAVAAEDGFELVRDGSRKTESKILIFEFGE